MSKRTYYWNQAGTQYRLYVDEIHSNYSVSLAIGDDVSFQINNPISIHVRFDNLDAHDIRGYKMRVDGINLAKLAYHDAKEIARALNCELTEQCDKCKDIAPLNYSLDLDYTHVCMNCLNNVSLGS